MAISTELQARIAAAARELSAELGDIDESQGDCWLGMLEDQADEIGEALTRAVLEEQAARRVAPAEAQCPQCHRPGRYTGDRERELLGRRGPVTIREPKYHCPCCRKDFFPADGSDRG